MSPCRAPQSDRTHFSSSNDACRRVLQPHHSVPVPFCHQRPRQRQGRQLEANIFITDTADVDAVNTCVVYWVYLCVNL